jgi:hypothetical protein
MSFKKYTTSEQAILTTLLYSDIFSFPITKDELWKFLIAPQKIAKTDFERSLRQLTEYISFQDGYFCLKGKEKYIAKRKQNGTEVEKKMQRTLSVTKKLSRIPSLMFVGISGGLAVGNVTKDDDIDLVIIVKKNTLFVSRFLIVIFLEMLGVRRSRNQKHTSDTICVNLLFDETFLGWFTHHQDIYTAREIGQIIPLFERDNTYKRFIQANNWIKQFLPNCGYARPAIAKNFERAILTYPGIAICNPVFERFLRQLQLLVIKRHRTNEIIENHLLAFHPYDYRIKTLRQLRLKMRQFGLLTKI